VDSGPEGRGIDSGPEEADSGPEGVHSGPEGVDSGLEGVDSGPEGVDSGAEGVDSGRGPCTATVPTSSPSCGLRAHERNPWGLIIWPQGTGFPSAAQRSD
jgi:hypothetical protein